MDLQFCRFEQLSISVSPHVRPTYLPTLLFQLINHKWDVHTIYLHFSTRVVLISPIVQQSLTHIDGNVIRKLQRSRIDWPGDYAI